MQECTVWPRLSGEWRLFCHCYSSEDLRNRCHKEQTDSQTEVSAQHIPLLASSLLLCGMWSTEVSVQVNYEKNSLNRDVRAIPSPTALRGGSILRPLRLDDLPVDAQYLREQGNHSSEMRAFPPQKMHIK